MSNLFSVIVPVYNRPVEVDEFLASLTTQTDRDFEVVIVEDGSTEDCKEEIEKYRDELVINYFYKQNTGPGDSRNYGMQRAKGDYFLIFDSDCIIPQGYIEEVRRKLDEAYVHCFGGPDAAHESFSTIQKAIDYAMTSFWTTGGIRGRAKSLTRFQPRSFNMGLSREVFEKTGGFRDIHPGEDPDLSLRIWDMGYDTRLFPGAYVYHKRRISFSKFRTQVHKFGLVRPILNKWHSGSGKITYWLPFLFILFSFFSLLGAVFIDWVLILPVLFYALLLLGDALYKTGNFRVAVYALFAGFIQLYSYGWGFFRSWLKVHLLKRNIRTTFPQLFFN